MGNDLMGLWRGHASHAPPTSCQVWCGSLGTPELERRTAATVWQFPNCTGFNPEICYCLSDVLLSGISLSWHLANHLTISFQTILVFRTWSDPRTREQMWIALHVGIGNRFLERMKWNSSNSTLTFSWAHHGKPGTPPTHRPFSKHEKKSLHFRH